jgi:hypothetical protein
MRARATMAALALVGGLCASIVGAAPAWAGNGETATSLNFYDSGLISSAHYGELVSFAGVVRDDSDSCTNILTHDCDYPAGSVSYFDGAATTPFGTDTTLERETFLTNVTCCVDHEVLYAGLTPGEHTIDARYTSTNDFDNSNAASNPNINDRGPHKITISAEPTSTTLTQDSTATTTGQGVTFTVTVTPNHAPDTAHGAGVATGSVEIREVVGPATTIFGVGTINASGVATITLSNVPAGAHNLKAQYLGDGNYTASGSTTVSHSVSQGSTSGALTTSATGTVFGQAVTLTDTVSAVSPASGTPTGTVAFNDLSTAGSAGSQALDGSGVAALVTSTLAVGPNTIQADYPGDAKFLGSSSNQVTVTVAKANTTTVLGSSANPSTFGQNVTLTATVAPVAPGGGTADGTVQFKDGATNLVPPRSLSGGAATFSSPGLGAGTHPITAAYLGSANYNASSGTLTQTVTCTTTITGTVSTVNIAPAGSTCITNANVTGGITVPSGAKVSVVNSTLGGGITSTGGAAAITVCGSTVGGAVSITGATGFVLLGDSVEDACAGNQFRAGVTLSSNSGGLNLGDNRIGGHVNITNNVGAGPAPNHTSPEIEANIIGGKLACSGDSPVAADDGRPSSSAGRSGECGAPAF